MASSASANRGSVVITGASSGIGRACALRLDQLGFRVFAGVRQTEAGDDLQRLTSGRITPLQLDVTDCETINRAVDAVAAAVGSDGLAGLVNNAGITVPGPLELMPLNDVQATLEVNVVGLIAVTQAFLPLLRTSHGRIVNIGSLAGRVSLPFYGAYAASKFAVEALTDALRVELRPWRIPVSSIEPGIISSLVWTKAVATIEDWIERAPPEAKALYSRPMTAAGANARQLMQAAFPPDAVARAVGDALTASRPRTRYRVGYTLRLRGLLLVARLPTPLRDAIIARALYFPLLRR